jgi:DNA-directed RNA polymerase specialized sigma subunit
MPQRNSRVPVDNKRAASSEIPTNEWDATVTAHDRFKQLLETQPRGKARYDTVLGEINKRQATLSHLRKARALTQSTVAQLLDMDQSEVSRLERLTDMLLSTLKRFVQATGGEMHIVVSYPDGGTVELLVGDE